MSRTRSLTGILSVGLGLGAVLAVTSGTGRQAVCDRRERVTHRRITTEIGPREDPGDDPAALREIDRVLDDIQKLIDEAELVEDAEDIRPPQVARPDTGGSGAMPLQPDDLPPDYLDLLRNYYVALCSARER